MKRTLLLAAAVPLVLLPGLMSGSAAATEPPPDTGTAGGASIALAIGGPGAPGRPGDDGLLKVVRCLRDHGVDIPDPVPGGGPVTAQSGPGTADEFQAAVEACPPPGAREGHDAGGLTRADPAELKPFAQCMRDNGVPDFPDPRQDGRGVVLQKSDGAQPGDAAFDGAQKACDKLLPTPPAGGGKVVIGGIGVGVGTAPAGAAGVPATAAAGGS